MSNQIVELFDSPEKLSELANEAREVLRPITPDGVQWLLIPCAMQINSNTKDVRLWSRGIFGTEPLEHDMMAVSLLATLVAGALAQQLAEETASTTEH